MKKHILIVDNEPTVTFFLAENLTDLGADYVIETCQSGAEALALTKAKLFDLVITDYRMPEMNGLQLIRCLNQRRPQVKLILMTAYGDDTVVQKARELCVNGYIAKPFDMDELLAAVRTVLLEG